MKRTARRDPSTAFTAKRASRANYGMLKGIDLLIYDIQDMGSRSYTYTTLLRHGRGRQNMHRIMVLDRPNPISGLIIDGPMLEEKSACFVWVYQRSLLPRHDGRGTGAAFQWRI